MENIWKTLLVLWITLIIIWVIVIFLNKLWLWIWNLPWDIKIEKENTKIYFPVTSFIIISILLSIIINLIYRYFG